MVRRNVSVLIAMAVDFGAACNDETPAAGPAGTTDLPPVHGSQPEDVQAAQISEVDLQALMERTRYALVSASGPGEPFWLEARLQDGSVQHVIKYLVGRPHRKTIPVRIYVLADDPEQIVGGEPVCPLGSPQAASCEPRETFDSSKVCNPVAYPTSGSGCARPDGMQTVTAASSVVADASLLLDQCCVSFALDKVGWVRASELRRHPDGPGGQRVFNQGLHEERPDGSRARFAEVYVVSEFVEPNALGWTQAVGTGVSIRSFRPDANPLMQARPFYLSGSDTDAHRTVLAHETMHELGHRKHVTSGDLSKRHLMFPNLLNENSLLDPSACVGVWTSGVYATGTTR